MRKKMVTGVVAALVFGLSACNCRAQDCVDNCVDSHSIHANYAFSQSIMNSFVPDCGEWMVLNPECRAQVRAKYLAMLQDTH